MLLTSEVPDHNDCGQDGIVQHNIWRAIVLTIIESLKSLSAVMNSQAGKEASSSWLVGVSAGHSPSASGHQRMCRAAAVDGVATNTDPLLFYLGLQ